MTVFGSYGLDLDDTDACERARDCANCGNRDVLTVRTATTAVGVVCLTLCPSCIEAGDLPRLGAVQAVHMSLAHCQHLGITADDMQAAMDHA